MSVFAPRFATVLVVLSFLLCAPGRASAADTRLPLWEVRSDKSAVYLFGTIHVGKREFYPLPAPVESAYRRAAAVALEIDSTDTQALTAAISAGLYTPPDRLSDHLSAELQSRLKQAIGRFGIPDQQLQVMKPFMVMLTLTSLEYSRLGYDATLGLDVHFADRATKDSKKIIALESAASQFAMMNSLSAELQQELLDVTLRELENNEVPALIQTMVSSWTTSDLGQLERVLGAEEKKLSKDRASEFHDKFLTRRNQAMAEKIAAMLRDKPEVFVAVGAAHLLGEDGIVALLRKKGYQVRQL
jgi:uncharacterized protein YbaP (TraB family)